MKLVIVKGVDKSFKKLKNRIDIIISVDGTQIEFRHIIYIEKEQDSKRCIIKTTYGDQYINKSLNDMYELLDSRFIKTSRSCIANSDFIKEFIIAENKLVFKNGEYTYLISRSMKKGLRKYDRVNN